MLHNITQPGEYTVPVGPSGRIVIEIDPDLKVQLYEALKTEGISLKDWFLGHVDSYLADRVQLSLELDEEQPSRRMAL
jgi:hypothetical protein